MSTRISSRTNGRRVRRMERRDTFTVRRPAFEEIRSCISKYRDLERTVYVTVRQMQEHTLLISSGVIAKKVREHYIYGWGEVGPPNWIVRCVLKEPVFHLTNGGWRV